MENIYEMDNICPDGSEKGDVKNQHIKVSILYLIEGERQISPKVFARCLTPCSAGKECKYYEEDGIFALVNHEKKNDKTESINLRQEKIDG